MEEICAATTALTRFLADRLNLEVRALLIEENDIEPMYRYAGLS